MQFIYGVISTIIFFVLMRIFLSKKISEKIANKGLDNILAELDTITTLLSDMHVVETKKELQQYVYNDTLRRVGRIEGIMVKMPVLYKKITEDKRNRITKIVDRILTECSIELSKLNK